MSLASSLKRAQRSERKVFCIIRWVQVQRSNKNFGTSLFEFQPVLWSFGSLISGICVQWLQHETLHTSSKRLQQIRCYLALNTWFTILLLQLFLYTRYSSAFSNQAEVQITEWVKMLKELGCWLRLPAHKLNLCLLMGYCRIASQFVIWNILITLTVWLLSLWGLKLYAARINNSQIWAILPCLSYIQNGLQSCQ